MATPYDLTQLDSYSFEHMVNFLAMKVLGNGITGFATGPDGGRDGYLKGKAPYPSMTDNWEGIWYIQSKFHKPTTNSNSQKWLVREVVKEIKAFSENDERKMPDIWIIASNVEPSGVPQTGAYDKIIGLVKKYYPNIKVDVWGGRKILDFLVEHPVVAKEYGHFLTPGHIITELYNSLTEKNFNIKSLIDHFMINQFKDLSYTKLEQAGSNNDHKPKIHELFRDLPIKCTDLQSDFNIMESLVSSSCNVHKISTWLNFGTNWKAWAKNPRRTRIVLLKGGPGQGKSTVGQYFAQIQRAAFILSKNAPTVTPQVKEIAVELKEQALKDGYWPKLPRIPIFIELKDYANWYITKDEFSPKNIIEYICDKINYRISFVIDSNDLRKILSQNTCFINFDGLDEVPNDLKDHIANEVITFSNEFLPSIDSDSLILCTTRPQGYSGQFDDLDASVCTLQPLPEKVALSCAEPILRFNRSEEDGNNSLSILASAMLSPQVKEIMATPLQSHIIAVLVRDGGRPPEKRWELFNNFYVVMKKRETLKNFPDPKISALLQEKDQLLKAIHDRLGICLHVRAEYSDGAETAMPKSEFRQLAFSTTEMLIDGNVEETVKLLMEAAIERLVFVNTPDSTEYVRFDIRQLQEFFAAEFIHNEVTDQVLLERLSIICSDAHWREVVHFVLSALIHYKRKTALILVSSLLQQVDDNDDNRDLRYFSKRSSIGSLLVLRLVEEGLLEQDKRIRSLFNKCLPSLWSCPDFDVFKKIPTLRMEQSKSWLLNNMIDTFLTVDYSETIACGLLFTVMLPKNNERFDEVIDRLNCAPIYYWKAILTASNIEFHHTHNNILHPWFIKVIVDKYFAHDTDNEILYLIDRYLKMLMSVNPKTIFMPEICEKQKSFLRENFDMRSRRMISANISESKYCFVKLVNHYKILKDGDSLLNPVDFFDSIYSYPVEIFKSIYEYVLSQNIDSLRKTLDMIKSNDYEIRCIPASILAMIPLNFDDESYSEHICRLLDFNDIELRSYTNNNVIDGQKILPGYEFVGYERIPFDANKWRALCNDYPELALETLVSPYFEREDIEDALKENRRDIMLAVSEIAINKPNVFAKYYLLWNEVFSVSPDSENHIKNTLISLSDAYKYKLIHGSTTLSLYKINYPSEKKLIPFLSYSLISSKPTIDKIKKENNDNFNNGIIGHIGLTEDGLLSDCLDLNESINFRASCLALLLFNLNFDKSNAIDYFFKNELDKICISLYCNESSKILTYVIYNLLHDVSNIDVRLQEFLGKYSYLTRHDINCRYMLQNIYNKWRERSGSVVNDTKALDKWLES
ncbi:hypothetical protein F3J28_01080 [Enterobacter sp. Ap-1006]|uniref:NACHT domain-containing protein n=1 Tax=Enterobacter sp. Ap-1006 TaxID=2608345 RepID=UPI001422CC3F|nr:hypothetical protein [Enterobacter sp. Ap-1006]NIF46361.1 hypothetical protein [Enterobacter sp. Ap-1006]